MGIEMGFWIWDWWEWNLINIIGALAVIIIILVGFYIAYHLAKKERQLSDRLCKQNSKSDKYNQKSDKTKPKCPHWPVPNTMKYKAQYITDCNSNNNNNKVFHKLVAIINRLTTKCKRNHKEHGIGNGE
jgi:hypothetical protein